MKAIAITRAATDGNNIEFLQEIDLPMPVATGHDLLVEVKAISSIPLIPRFAKVLTPMCRAFWAGTPLAW